MDETDFVRTIVDLVATLIGSGVMLYDPIVLETLVKMLGAKFDDNPKIITSENAAELEKLYRVRKNMPHDFFLIVESCVLRIRTCLHP
jgi:hypothetical protein